MKRSRFSILFVTVLLGLLGWLAFLQYQWLGQISDGERERMQRNLQTDTARFAEDFNREIQNAYFNFQLNSDVWREQNWNEFGARYKFWRERTQYRDLIKDFYFVEVGENQKVTRFNKENGAFEPADWNENLDELKPKIVAEGRIQPVAEEIPALLMPIHDAQQKIERILIRTKEENQAEAPPEDLMPKRFGVLVIELDETVIKNQLFPELVKKHFSESESANYHLAVENRASQTIFQTENLTATDAEAKLLYLSPDNFIFFANREILSTIEGEKRSVVYSSIKTRTEATEKRDKIILNRENSPQLVRKTPATPRTEANSRVEFQVMNRTDDPQKVRIFESEIADENSAWTLKVQHTSGSLEQFITNTRRKNLGISFGILSLLAASMILIFVSAQRAKLFAQRQIEFVSSVSHEFRTPLAVIYSAGENLADGVAKEEKQVSRYGNLIKGEGKKLSAMVEQILEFAGAKSGKKKYDFRETDVRELIENAIRECQPLIDEKNFTIESEIAANLPKIKADRTALGQAVQNLIANSIKYSNGNRWLKISARNGDGSVKISVEDKGIGIEPKDLRHIFEPFYRAKSVVDEQIHGSGLGLSLVKQTVEAHGGRVSAESEPKKGSKFTIHLPLNS
jgi:signal transduction histidine kinase